MLDVFRNRALFEVAQHKQGSLAVKFECIVGIYTMPFSKVGNKIIFFFPISNILLFRFIQSLILVFFSSLKEHKSIFGSSHCKLLLLIITLCGFFLVFTSFYKKKTIDFEIFEFLMLVSSKSLNSWLNKCRM